MLESFWFHFKDMSSIFDSELGSVPDSNKELSRFISSGLSDGDRVIVNPDVVSGVVRISGTDSLYQISNLA